MIRRNLSLSIKNLVASTRQPSSFRRIISNQNSNGLRSASTTASNAITAVSCVDLPHAPMPLKQAMPISLISRRPFATQAVEEATTTSTSTETEQSAKEATAVPRVLIVDREQQHYYAEKLRTIAIKNKSMAQALQIFNEMTAKGLQADVKIYNLLLEACQFQNRSNRAFDFYNEMLSLGLEPDNRTYCVLLRVLSHAEDSRFWTVIDHLRNSHKRPSPYYYNVLIDACAQDIPGMGRRPLTNCFVGRYSFDVSYADQVDTEITPLLARAGGGSNSHSDLSPSNQALRLFDEMLREGIEPNNHVFAALIHALRVRADVRIWDVYQLAKRTPNISLDLVMYTDILSACATLYEAGVNMNRVMEIREEMTKRGMVLDERAYGALLLIYEHARQKQHALALYEEMKENSAKGQFKLTQHSFIRLFRVFDEDPMVFTLYKDMKRYMAAQGWTIGTNEFNAAFVAMLKVCKSTKDEAKFAEVLDEFRTRSDIAQQQKQKLEISDELYSLLFDLCIMIKRADIGMNLFQQIQDQKNRLNTTIYNAAMNMLYQIWIAEGSKMSEVAHLDQLMDLYYRLARDARLKPNAQTLDIVLNVLYKMRRRRKGFEIWDSLVMNRAIPIVPMLETCRTFLLMCAFGHDDAHAILMLNRLSKEQLASLMTLSVMYDFVYELLKRSVSASEPTSIISSEPRHVPRLSDNAFIGLMEGFALRRDPRVIDILGLAKIRWKFTPTSTGDQQDVSQNNMLLLNEAYDVALQYYYNKKDVRAARSLFDEMKMTLSTPDGVILIRLDSFKIMLRILSDPENLFDAVHLFSSINDLRAKNPNMQPDSEIFDSLMELFRDNTRVIEIYRTMRYVEQLPTTARTMKSVFSAITRNPSWQYLSMAKDLYYEMRQDRQRQIEQLKQQQKEQQQFQPLAPIDVDTFRYLFKTASLLRDPNMALAVWEDLRQQQELQLRYKGTLSGVVAEDPATQPHEQEQRKRAQQTQLHYLFSTLCDAGDARVWDLYADVAKRDNPIPDRTVFALLLKRCKEEGDSKHGFFLAQEMNRYGIPLDADAYTNLIALCDSRSPRDINVHQAYQLWDRMRKQNVAPALETYNIMIRLLSRFIVGHNVDADVPEQQRQQHQKQNQQGDGGIDAVDAEAGMIKNAFDMYHSMIRDGLVPNNRTLVWLVRICTLPEHFTVIGQVVDLMRKNHVPLQLDSYNALISKCITNPNNSASENVEAAEKFFERMVKEDGLQPNVDTYKALMLVYGRAHYLDLVFAVYRKVKEVYSAVTGDKGTQASNLLKHQQPHLATPLEEGETEFDRLAPVFLRIVVDLCVEAGDIQRLVGLVREIKALKQGILARNFPSAAKTAASLDKIQARIESTLTAL
eukprot:GEZU01019656.1.p1 GENE.GEZU01019656.1~~GEZU01019656.1.p1  ORF type:complete len:1365 (+),score=335.11 GEZU01019656.1:75-4169(+)